MQVSTSNRTRYHCLGISIFHPRSGPQFSTQGLLIAICRVRTQSWPESMTFDQSAGLFNEDLNQQFASTMFASVKQ